MYLSSMDSQRSAIISITFILVVAIWGVPRALEVMPHTFDLGKAVVETGTVKKTDDGLIIEPDTRIRFDYVKASGLRNAHLLIDFVPPDLNKSMVPVPTQRMDYLYALKITNGHMVTEVSDQGVRISIQDRTESVVDTVLAENSSKMFPDGRRRWLGISIEDRRAYVFVDGDTLISCNVGTYDFSLLQIAAFGRACTIQSVSLQPIIRPALVIDTANRSILLDAIYYPSRFNHNGGLHNHHFITWGGGKAAMQALIQTNAPDSLVYDALVALGVKPGNNLTLDSWNKRRDKAAPEPDMRAEGDRLSITVVYGGHEFSPTAVLADRKGNSYDFRFAGNRAFIPAWRSGCVVCLQSCPGSKISNSTYTIRDLELNKVSFKPAPSLPFIEGDPILVRIKPTL
jgi:hypothetical protein